MSGMQAVRGAGEYRFAGPMFDCTASHGPAEGVRDAANDRTGAHASAGEAVRAARLAADLSVDAFAAETGVPVRVLRAIERDDFSDSRSRVGAVTHAIQIARFLGLDETRLSREVRAALLRLPERVPASPESVDDTGDRLAALVGATLLFVTFVALAGGLSALLLH